MATDSRNIDYATKYAKELDQIFSHASQTLGHMKNRGEYKEDGGVASVYFRTVDTSDFLQGHTSAKFGDATAVNSDVVRKDVELFYEINKMMTAVQLDDSAGALKEAGRIMNLAITEQYAPLLDKIALSAAINAALSYKSGSGSSAVQTNVVAYDANDILKGIGDMQAILKNQRSFSKTQTLYIAASIEPLLDKNLFTSYTPAKNNSVIDSGEIKSLKGIAVEVVPDDFFCTSTYTGQDAHKQAQFTEDPTIKAVLWDNRVMGSVNKLKEVTTLTGDLARAAGYDGAVLRGLFRPGAWVFDAGGRKKGVVVLKDTSSKSSS